MGDPYKVPPVEILGNLFIFGVPSETYYLWIE